MVVVKKSLIFFFIFISPYCFTQTIDGKRPTLALKVIKEGIPVKNNALPTADIIYNTKIGDSLIIYEKIISNDFTFYKLHYIGRNVNGNGYVSGYWLEDFTKKLNEFNNYFVKKRQDSIYKVVMIKDSINNILQHKQDSINRIIKLKNDSIQEIVIKKQLKVEDSIEALKQAKILYYQNKGIPLMYTGISLYKNSIGTPQVTLNVQNISKKIIDAYTVKIYCYNNFYEPVYWLGTNIFSGISQDKLTTISSDEWSLVGFDNATKVIAYLVKVHFTDNTTWYSPNIELMSIKNY